MSLLPCSSTLFRTGASARGRLPSASTLMLPFLCVLLAAALPPVTVAKAQRKIGEFVADTNEPSCVPAPVCSRYKWLSSSQVYCWMSKLPSVLVTRELPFATDDQALRLAVSNVEKLLRTRLVGQGHLTETVVSLMRKKLSYPHEPLVLHFAGDNGVGKTYTARLLSLGTSLRCSPSRGRQCDVGDNMLVVSGTGFGGVDPMEGFNLTVKRIAEHQRKYPHGIVLLDDLNAMHPALVTSLAPLFGRAERFEGQPTDLPSLRQLTVIVTTDFGKQGRTFGKSIVELEKMVRAEFNSLYGPFVPAFVRTLAFATFSKRTAEEMVRSTVVTLPCTAYRHPSAGAAAYGGVLIASSIDDVAVSFLVEKHREAWEGRENGHALRRAVEDELLSLLLKYFDGHGHDRKVWARFHLDEEANEIVLDAGEETHNVNDL